MSAFAEALQEALRNHPLEASAIGQIEEHWRLVLAWNKRVNLTAIEDDRQAAWMHYADSLAGRTALVPGPICDLGSGAGYPGMPLAIACPDRQVTLVEPRQKRASFLDVCCTRLGLKNVRVVVGRSEETPVDAFANVVTRATFSATTDLEACLRWVAPGGKLIAYRADAAPAPGPEVIRYPLNGETHELHVWSKT